MIKKLSVASAVAIVIVIVATIEGWLTPIQGIILGVLAFLAPIIVTAIISTVITNALAPKPSLKIENVRFIKQSFQNVDGYLIKAKVTNKREKICFKIDATFRIEDENGNPPNLLKVKVEKTRGHETVNSREEAMSERYVGYAWIQENGTITQDNFEKLRQKDHLDLLFPYETMYYSNGSSRSSSLTSHYFQNLLKIEPAKKYHVTITVKGEDSDNNTISKTTKKTLSI